MAINWNAGGQSAAGYVSGNLATKVTLPAVGRDSSVFDALPADMATDFMAMGSMVDWNRASKSARGRESERVRESVLFLAASLKRSKPQTVRWW